MSSLKENKDTLDFNTNKMLKEMNLKENKDTLDFNTNKMLKKMNCD
jgi:hypothetical protein